MQRGLFPHIRFRPFNLVPDPKHLPRAIFITAIETRPFLPPFEMHVEGEEIYFAEGLKALSKLAPGRVHLVYRSHSDFPPFIHAEQVEKHTVEGPHPAGCGSVHIHAIDPIRRPNDYVWTLTALDVVIVGKMVREGRYHVKRIISLAGPGIADEKRGFFIGRQGYPVKELMKYRSSDPLIRFISGDPLTGTEVETTHFLGFNHTCFSAFPINITREPFHFFQLGRKKYSATRAYLSGHISPPPEGYHFTTNQHGEERAFIDPSVYDKVMPLEIPTMLLVKAILAEDFEKAERLGVLEVVPEDFALPDIYLSLKDRNGGDRKTGTASLC